MRTSGIQGFSYLHLIAFECVNDVTYSINSVTLSRSDMMIFE
jgi:hypothetical protein